MKRLAVLLGFVLILGALPTFVPQPASAMPGSGTSGDPYVIYNVTDLQNMNLNLDAWYVVHDDIDASATSGWNGGAGFIPIGNATHKFSGHFDGNFSTITGLYIDRPTTDYIGLFGWVQGSAGDTTTIGNVTLVDIDFTGDDNMGGLAGYLYGYASVSYCKVYGNITGGTSDPTYNGGLVGFAQAVTITKCEAHVNVDGGGTLGRGTTAGGFIGRASTSTTITESCAYGDVWAHNWVGGFVGEILTGTTISDCYARGDVYVTDNQFVGQGQNAGGFVGVVIGSMYRSYSTGYIWCLDVHGCTMIGGFAGQVTTSCTACFWDVQTSGKATSACGTGKTTAEMKTQTTFTDAGWDFSTVWHIAGSVNDGYPYLLWWYDPPDLISDVNQVVWFQPNAIIQGVILPNRAQGGTLQDGEFIWGANPAGITITHGELIAEDEYNFEPVMPGSWDIIQPNPGSMTTDVDTAGLVNNPLYPLVHALGSQAGLTDRLVWLILAWLILIGSMLFVHIGFDTKKDTEKPHHFVLTTVVGLGLSILFYTMGIFPLWVVILLAFGFIGAIVYERQPVL